MILSVAHYSSANSVRLLKISNLAGAHKEYNSCARSRIVHRKHIFDLYGIEIFAVYYLVGVPVEIKGNMRIASIFNEEFKCSLFRIITCIQMFGGIEDVYVLLNGKIHIHHIEFSVINKLIVAIFGKIGIIGKVLVVLKNLSYVLRITRCKNIAVFDRHIRLHNYGAGRSNVACSIVHRILASVILVSYSNMLLNVGAISTKSEIIIGIYPDRPGLGISLVKGEASCI